LTVNGYIINVVND